MWKLFWSEAAETERRIQLNGLDAGVVRATGRRGRPTGALHSRIVENNIAAAKIAKTIKRFGRPSYRLHRWPHRSVRAPPGVSARRVKHSFCGVAHPILVARVDPGTIRKVTSDDLEVGLICSDRDDGNRVRILAAWIARAAYSLITFLMTSCIVCRKAFGNSRFGGYTRRAGTWCRDAARRVFTEFFQNPMML